MGSNIEKVSKQELDAIQEVSAEFKEKLKFKDGEIEVGKIYMLYYGHDKRYTIIKIREIINKKVHWNDDEPEKFYFDKKLVYSIFDVEKREFYFKEDDSNHHLSLDSSSYYSLHHEIKDPSAILDEAQEYYDGKKKFEVEEDTAGDEDTSLMSFGNKETYVNLQTSLQERRKGIELVKASIQMIVQEQMDKVEMIKRNMEAQVAIFQKQLTKLHKVIVTLELYAGIKEELVQISEGVPASSETPLTIRQEMLYFDEEIADPRLNDNQGFSFRDVGNFWEWLIDSEHFKVMLPEERCMVACRIRRESRKHEVKNLAEAFMAAEEDKLDMMTYLLVRNGENVYYISTDNINFYEKTFPHRKEMLYLEEVMSLLYGVDRVDELINTEEVIEKKTVTVFSAGSATEEEREEKKKIYTWKYDQIKHVLHRDPYRVSGQKSEKLIEELDERMFNFKMRFALFQGLIDRANIFVFPERVSVFNPDSQEKGYINLLYDGEVAFPSHRLPFKDWRAEIDKTITYGSRIIIAWGNTRYDYKGDQNRFDDRFNSWSRSDFDKTPRYPEDGMYIIEKMTKEVSENQFLKQDEYNYRVPYAEKVYEKNGKYYADFMIIKYNPGDEVGWGGWGDWDPHKRKNKLSFKLDPKNDGFIINYDQVERDTVEFYMNDRINKKDYLNMMPFLNELRLHLLKEEEQEELFSNFILDEIRRNHKDLDRFTPGELLPQIKEDIDWYKYKNQLKRPVTKEEDKAYRMIMRRWKSREGMVKHGDTIEALVERHLKRSGQNKES